MDKTTLKDIRQRIARWQKEEKTNGRESERTWIFAVNIDDVNLLLKEIERLDNANNGCRAEVIHEVGYLNELMTKQRRYIEYLQTRLSDEGDCYFEFEEWEKEFGNGK